MVTTVAEIAELAFTSVNAAISGVIYPATMAYDTVGAYNPATGKHIAFSTPVTGGRAVLSTSAPVQTDFPAYVAGAADQMMLLEGFTTVPQVGWTVTADGATRTIKAVLDVAGAGEFFKVVAA